MNNVKFMLKLISAAVYTKDYPCEETVNWDLIYDVSVSHNLANVIAYAVVEGKYSAPVEVASKLMKKMYEGVTVCENQKYEAERVFDAFEKSNIEYMPVKGSVIRALYPVEDMRNMADADVLIHTDDFEKINEIMTELGYLFDGESNHEYNYTKKPFMHIELHKYLVPSYNDDLYSYYGDGWKLAKRVSAESSRFELSIEDHFIYLVTHFAKHYRDAGVGLRPVVDIWLYMKRHPEMDMDDVTCKLAKLNLDEFFKNLTAMISAWFEDGAWTQTAKEMTAFVLKSGTFGTLENSNIAKTIRDNQGADKEKAIKYRYMKVLFPSYEHMVKIYPYLEKRAYLLVFFWIFRLFERVFSGKKTIKEYKSEADIIKSDSLKEYEKHMKTVGLDIYNGR